MQSRDEILNEIAALDRRASAIHVDAIGTTDRIEDLNKEHERLRNKRTVLCERIGLAAA